MTEENKNDFEKIKGGKIIRVRYRNKTKKGLNKI